jgi:hypothetical protein
MNYTWNDMMDPNPQYSSDTAKAGFAEKIPFAKPTDYYLRISWNDISTANAAGEFISGWLAGVWEYVKSK